MSSKNRNRIIYAVIGIAVIVVAVIAAVYFGTRPAASAQKLKVAFLMSGTTGDYGWNYEIDRGAKLVQSLMPNVDVVEAENVAGADAPIMMKAYADQGCTLIFCTSFEMGAYIHDLAPSYPKVVWAWVTGTPNYKGMNATTYPNVLYFTEMPDGDTFAEGIIAGMMTKTNMIGWVGAVQNPPQIREIDAYARGLALVNPNATVHVLFVGTYYDPPSEKEATTSLLEAGCDVIAHHTDDPAPGIAVEDWFLTKQKQVYFLSAHTDTRIFAPDVYLTGFEWNHYPVFADIIDRVINGTYHQYLGISGYYQDWYVGLDFPGGSPIVLTPYSSLVPKAAQTMANNYLATIKNDTYTIFPDYTLAQLRALTSANYDKNVVHP